MLYNRDMAVKKYPGFIDGHVHLREPGATHKEDFNTGSRAAAVGGFIFIMDMPNNAEPTINRSALEEKILRAEHALTPIGFHYGTNGMNADTFEEVKNNSHVFGLKIYCNHTTGEMLIEDIDVLTTVFSGWHSDKPILVHAEGTQLASAIALAHLFDRRLHVCHISQEVEVELVRQAKKRGIRISAGVCPHHLYMTGDDREKLKGYAVMKPPLGTKKDQDALWRGLEDDTIDIVETDHAPHTKEEKEKDPPAFGVPGLETAVPLMFKAVKDGRLTEDKLIKKMFDNPKRIFNVPDMDETYVELDPDEEFKIGDCGYETKCNWSPFDGWTAYGKPKKVVIKGKVVLEEGKIIEN